jgi:hypothetical protein
LFACLPPSSHFFFLAFWVLCSGRMQKDQKIRPTGHSFAAVFVKTSVECDYLPLIAGHCHCFILQEPDFIPPLFQISIWKQKCPRRRR